MFGGDLPHTAVRCEREGLVEGHNKEPVYLVDKVSLFDEVMSGLLERVKTNLRRVSACI